MSKLSNPTRVTKENVPKEYQDIVQSVGGPYNAFSDEVYFALNGNLTVSDNLNMRYKVIDLSVNASGNPIIATQFKNTMNVKPTGILVIKVENLTNPTVYPTGAPFASYSENGGVITLNNITGLSTGNKWRITLLTLGN